MTRAAADAGWRTRRTTAWLVGVALVLTTITAATAAPAGAAPGDVGIEGQAYVQGGFPTVSMAESKLWFHDGTWFAAMRKTSADPTDADFVIHKLVGDVWTPTATLIDDRATTKQDVLSVGDTLYVLSHKRREMTTGVESPNPANQVRLAKFTYDTGTDTYTAVTGFPKVLSTFEVESMTLDIDAQGVLWTAWAQKDLAAVAPNERNDVFVQRSTDGGATWSAPTDLDVAHPPGPDDIASLVAFGDRVGIMWGARRAGDDGHWFTSTAAGPGTPSWSAPEAAFVGASRGDDKFSLKAVGGQVVAAVKTTVGLSSNALVAVLKRSEAGTWSATNAWSGVTLATRPVIAVDATNGVLHVFATLPNGDPDLPFEEQGVYTKSTSLATPAFTPGAQGTPVMTRTVGDDPGNIADLTTTKQPLTSASGIVALAADSTTDRYWTHRAPIAPVGEVPPSAPASATATAGRRSATVSWGAATAGTTPITGYRITANPALPSVVPDQPADARGPLTITGLTTGTAYTFQVRAVSGPLVGPAASASPVTPNNHQPFATVNAFADRQAQDFLRVTGEATAAQREAVRQTVVVQDRLGAAAVLGPDFFRSPSVAGPALKGIQAQVVRLYFAYFLRAPDTAGFDFWVGQRQCCLSLEQVSQRFSGTPEFKRLYGANLTNGQFVDLVYENVLDRAADARGRAFWINELECCIGRGRMMTKFSESGEFIGLSERRMSVAIVYRWMLDRAPTSQELAAEVAKPTMEAVVDGILTSTAYRNRVLP